jgi:hypothetical protein
MASANLRISRTSSSTSRSFHYFYFQLAAFAKLKKRRQRSSNESRVVHRSKSEAAGVETGHFRPECIAAKSAGVVVVVVAYFEIRDEKQTRPYPSA